MLILQIKLGRGRKGLTLILSINEHGISFYLFVFFFFSNIVYFLIQRSCMYLFKPIPKCFKYFDAIVNGSLKILSSNYCQYAKIELIFVYLTLQLAMLLNSLISSTSGFIHPLGFFIYIFMSSTNKNNFTSSFPVFIHFIPRYCTGQKRRGES